MTTEKNILEVKMNLESELRRLDAIQTAIIKRYTDVSTIDGLEMLMDTLKKCLDLLK